MSGNLSQQQKASQTNDLANWMGNNSEKLACCQINEIFLPGTHDSGAYQVTGASVLDRPVAPLLDFAIKYVPFVHRIISRWTITQDKDIKGQLEAGVRALDLRISYNTKEKEFYISHTFDCVKLNTVLQQIKDFMDKHPQEVILVNIKTDSPNDDVFLLPNRDPGRKILTALSEKLTDEKMLGPLLCKKDEKDRDTTVGPLKDRHTQEAMQADQFDDEKLNIGKMVNTGQRILMCYSESSHRIPDPNNCIWQSRDVNFQNFWMDRSTGEEWEAAFQGKSVQERTTAPKKLLDISVCLTPNLNYILKNTWRDFLPSFLVASHSLKYMAKQTADLFARVVHGKNKENIKGGVISADFMCETKVVGDVIEKSLERADEVYKAKSKLNPSNAPDHKLINAVKNNTAFGTKVQFGSQLSESLKVGSIEQPSPKPPVSGNTI